MDDHNFVPLLEFGRRPQCVLCKVTGTGKVKKEMPKVRCTLIILIMVIMMMAGAVFGVNNKKVAVPGWGSCSYASLEPLLDDWMDSQLKKVSSAAPLSFLLDTCVARRPFPPPLQCCISSFAVARCKLSILGS